MTEHLSFVSKDDRSTARLQELYGAHLIVAEKKPFLIDLRRSSGPYLAVDEGGLISDVASQIATLGLGFNAGALFGAAQYLESWINGQSSPEFLRVRKAFVDLLRRKLGSCEYVAHFCGSGAEAVETALAHFFDRRQDPRARKVLAFEGSFHGRMLVALASTWNKAKREPFAWPGYESIFAPYPEMDGDDLLAPVAPAGWSSLWQSTDAEDFDVRVQAMLQTDDPLLRAEIAALQAVREHLQSGQVFAVVIEPMQCEGGDRYASARFHQGLALLAESLRVPLIHDEIQTGFGLGGEFFWHRMFHLRRADGTPYFPSAVICAKKAQTGLVLLHHRHLARTNGEWPGEVLSSSREFNAASCIRGYIQASVIDQFQESIREIERINREHLAAFVQRLAPHVTRPRVKGLSFAFELPTAEITEKFVASRFGHGLLFYPAGARTARFRLNLGFQPQDIATIWQQLEAALRATLDQKPAPGNPVPIVRPRDTRDHFAYHAAALRSKLAHLHGEKRAGHPSAVTFLRGELPRLAQGETLDVVPLDASNFGEYRERILALQAEVYEPARQTTAREFDLLFRESNPLAMLVLRQGQIVAMAFAGPLSAFQYTRGVPQDPFLHDPTIAYMVDLTVIEEFRGRLGRVMKQAITMLAQAQGYTAIHGRNRDRLAAGMWSINLGLGSYELQHLYQDYPDNKSFRDCIYYRCPTVWPSPPVDLAAALEAPLGVAHLDADYLEETLPDMVNKLTLSNFVTDRYLSHLQGVSQIFPVELRHLYTANGLSECVDKVAKVFWRHRRPRTRLLAFTGDYHGQGSLLSRSLSGLGTPFFDVTRLEVSGDALHELDERLAADDCLAVFVEPCASRTMRCVPEDYLAELVAICRRRGVPIVFNDTAGMFYRFNDRHFIPSAVPDLQPDAALAYLGGQMAVVAMSERYYLDEPLLLISTWEGDSLSLAQFHRALKMVEADRGRFFEMRQTFHETLCEVLERFPGIDAELRHGSGTIRGPLPASLQSLFRPVGPQCWLSCPSQSEMSRFVASAQVLVHD